MSQLEGGVSSKPFFKLIRLNAGGPKIIKQRSVCESIGEMLLDDGLIGFWGYILMYLHAICFRHKKGRPRPAG